MLWCMHDHAAFVRDTREFRATRQRAKIDPDRCFASTNQPRFDAIDGKRRQHFRT